MNKLTILTVCYNSSNFIIENFFSAKKGAIGKFDYLIIDNGSKKSHIKKLYKLKKTNDNVNVILSNNEHEFASYNHAIGVEKGLSKINTKYCFILDSDTIFLKFGWDQILFSFFKEKTAIVGFEATNRIGFPQIMFSCIDVKIFKENKISCMPSFENKKECNPLNDTAHQWKKLIKNYEIVTFPFKNTRDYSSPYFKNIIGIEEYYINDELYASHFGRGSSLGSAKYFKKIILPNFIKKAFGKYQISKWINKSKIILQNDKKNFKKLNTTYPS